MEYIISRSSIINRCNQDGQLHLFFTEKERPCEEAYLKEVLDCNDNRCIRYFINLDTIVELEKLGEKYGVDVLVTKNLDFPGYSALVLYDEELKQENIGSADTSALLDLSQKMKDLSSSFAALLMEQTEREINCYLKVMEEIF